MPIIRRTLAGVTQFQAGDPTSVFTFSSRSNLPRSTGISIGMVGYYEPKTGGTDPTVNIQVWVQRAGGDPTDRVHIGTAQASNGLLNPITGDAEMRLCGFELPREPGIGGQFWDVHLTTDTKLVTATAIVQWRITPGPETSNHDSPDR